MNLLQIFSPGAAIESINDFAGRDKQLSQAAKCLGMKGASIVVYGYRGVGKSSLAKQIVSLAERDANVLKRVPANFRNHSKYFTCFETAAYGVESTEAALSKVLTNDVGLRSYLTGQEEKRISEVSAALSFGGKDGGLNLGGKLASTSGIDQVKADLASIFKNAVRNVQRSRGCETLVVFDEFDRIRNQSGFAQFIKSCEGEPVRFLLVGIAKDISGLLEDHESAQRQIRDGLITVPPMTFDEQRQIFVQAHQKMGNAYEFSDPAIQYICKCSQGHPYIVHKIGHEALLLAADRSQPMITESIAKKGFSKITEGDSNFDLEIAYRKAVTGSSHREYVLKSFASQQVEEISTKGVYTNIETETDIPRAGIPTFTGHLLQEQFGSPLEKVRHGVYRFRDNIFKAYCAARPYMHWEDR